ncbi:tRNA adenosine(34) deaminase TadA [Eubacterium sp. AB3007]|jgi:tRNA(adenine34) deaminase|uniref:tRNA adenosine(34) deaminase TadA n=1 Tax=Eubacterium sp. AB3007 TaxID=1392487 RepID=UPI0004862C99|nr:tRNA adenosine(34) deaminase TadA [Eubacterium sp. AB3007]
MGYNKYMKEALREAEIAGSLGEVPIGAVIVRDGEIIARGHNLTETTHDPTAHAEMIAIRQAAQKLGGWRLPGCEMYVTCEPCTMCAGALVWSRMEKLHIATMDPKAGACGSVYDVVRDRRLNHCVEVETGMMAEEASTLLKSFFSELRAKRKNNRRTR